MNRNVPSIDHAGDSFTSRKEKKAMMGFEVIFKRFCRKRGRHRPEREPWLNAFGQRPLKPSSKHRYADCRQGQPGAQSLHDQSITLFNLVQQQFLRRLRLMEHYVASKGVVSKGANLTGCWVQLLQSPFVGCLLFSPM